MMRGEWSNGRIRTHWFIFGKKKDVGVRENELIAALSSSNMFGSLGRPPPLPPANCEKFVRASTASSAVEIFRILRRLMVGRGIAGKAPRRVDAMSRKHGAGATGRRVQAPHQLLYTTVLPFLRIFVEIIF